MVWWFFANSPPSWEATWSQLHWRKRTPVVKYVSLRHTTPSVLRGRLHVKVIPIFGKAELWFGNSSRHEAVKISVKYVWSVCDDGSSKHETCEYWIKARHKTSKFPVKSTKSCRLLCTDGETSKESRETLYSWRKVFGLLYYFKSQQRGATRNEV